MILVLGGTGFVGTCLRDLLSVSNEFQDSVLSSSNTGLKLRNRILSSSNNLSWNVLQPSSLEPEFELIVHAATPASAELTAVDPKFMFSQNVTAMSNVLEFAARHSEPPVVLFTSSGAVYGDMPEYLERIPEGWDGCDSTSKLDAYAEGKLAAEEMLIDATKKGKCVGLVARLFAFSGVHLPLDRHFAIGNFVRDAVRSRLITVRSDGSSIRSYLDGRDMANWLLQIASFGQPHEIYHVGSERSISIKELATLVSTRYELLTGTNVEVEVLGKTSNIDGVSRYVPSTEWTRQRLNVRETVTLEESIDQMIKNAIEVFK